MLRFSRFAAREIASAYRAMVDRGGAGSLELYEGDPPDSSEDDAEGECLARFDLAHPCGEASAGALRFESVKDATAQESGRPGWARLRNGRGDTVLDCSVGEKGSESEIEIEPLDLVKGGPVRFDGAALFVGEV